jgi:hypothetical protein
VALSGTDLICKWDAAVAMTSLVRYRNYPDKLLHQLRTAMQRHPRNQERATDEAVLIKIRGNKSEKTTLKKYRFGKPICREVKAHYVKKGFVIKIVNIISKYGKKL